MTIHEPSTAVSLAEADQEIYAILQAEEGRQVDGLEMIASENYTSQAVLEVVGSIFTNKYAEGYPGRRYYGGCVHVDEVERLAQSRALELFGGDHVNVQPHSGSAPNMAVYMAVLEPGDTIMGMSLEHGGHLTHGHPRSFSGMLYNVVSYGVDPDTELMDLDEIRRIARETRPKLIVSGSTAYPRIIDFARFAEIADEVGAMHMSDMAHIAGLVAGKAHPSPVPYADFVTSSTHKSLRGPRGGFAICREKYAKAIDSTVFPGIQGGPFMHVIAGKAVAFKDALSDDFALYAARVVENAKTLAEGLTGEGLRLVSGGTENHLMLMDLGSDGPSGRAMQSRLEKSGITANKNTVPRETRKATVTSGIRLGTPALTTRGMGPDEMHRIAGWIRRVHDAGRGNEDEFSRVRSEVEELARSYPVPGIRRS